MIETTQKKKYLKGFFWRVLILIIVVFLIFCLPFLYFKLVFLQNEKQNQNKFYETGIIFGAGVTPQGLPGYTLTARLEQGLALYKNKKITKILVSGDNRDKYYNEPKIMREYLIQRGVDPAKVVADFGGIDTISTCYRAKNYFKIQEATLITQEFHLARSTFLCKNFGIKVATSASESRNSVDFYGTLREIPSSILALFNSKRNFEPMIKSDGTEINFENL
jgi:SanA protein